MKNHANDSTTRTVSLGELQSYAEQENAASDYIRIPKYQRGIVWSVTQKQKLIESVYKGFPIGSLLCFKTGDKHSSADNRNRDVLDLVDGLQRTSTILSFLKAPLATAPVRESVDPDNISELSSICAGFWSQASEDRISTVIEEWMRGCKTTQAAHGFDGYKLFSKLSEIRLEEEPALGYEQLSDPIGVILDNIKNSVQAIREVKIPIVVYNGDAANVPEIFQRVNSQGTKLTKYEIYAASWMSSTTKISNAKIRKAVQDKYLQMTGEGYEISGFDESKPIPEEEFNLYEYLFGLGRVLCDELEFLFPEVSNADDATSVGFNIVTVAMGLRIGDMESLAAHLQKRKMGSPLDLTKLEDAILASSREVEKLLKPYLSLKLNNQGGKSRFLPHSQNQIISLITRYLIAKYDYKTWDLINSPEVDVLKKNIPAYYLFDMIREVWRGSGDSHLWNVCWTGEAPEPGEFPKGRADAYLQPISKDRWQMELLTWHDEQLGKRQRTRQYLTDKTRAVLKLIYSPIVSHFHNQASEFDLEHLYPVDVLKDHIGEDPDDGWPISAMGNLSLLPKDINRIKGKTMLGTYLEQPNVDTSGDEFNRLTSYVISPAITELKLSPDLDRDSYIQFCRARFTDMSEKLLAYLL